MPRKIQSNLSGANSLVRIYNKLIKVEDEIISLNFIHTSYISSEQLALLGAIIYSLIYKFKKKVYIVGCTDYIEDLFTGNGFDAILRDFRDGFKLKSAVKFKYFTHELNRGNTDCFHEYLNDEFFPKLEFNDDEETAYIDRYLSELFINARTHGGTTEIFCCGQKYPETSKMTFMMVDLGVGIPSNVRKIENLNDSESIKWSIGKGNTTKDLKKDIGGLGLNEVTEFINKHNGELTIISYKGRYNSKLDINEDSENIFYGTIVYIDFDYTMLNDVDDKFKTIKNDKVEWNF